MAGMYINLPADVHREVRTRARAELRKEQDQVVMLVCEALRARGVPQAEPTTIQQQPAPAGART